MVETLHCCVGLCCWECDGEGKCCHEGKEEFGELHRRCYLGVIEPSMRC